VEDPHLSEKVRALERRRNVQRALVVLLVLGTLGGGVALVRYLFKERQLAHLRSKLLANVSHELKTPVTSIRMLTEMLADDPVNEAQSRRFVLLLGAESVRLSQLFENLLDFSRLGRKDEVLPVEPVELGALLSRISEAFSLRAEEKKVRFLAEGLPGETWIVTNSGAVERILLNLLDNALKYGLGADPEIRFSAMVSPAGDSEKGSVCISVSDNGPGSRAESRKGCSRSFTAFAMTTTPSRARVSVLPLPGAWPGSSEGM